MSKFWKNAENKNLASCLPGKMVCHKIGILGGIISVYILLAIFTQNL
jgi:hypothetical protein